MGIYDNFYLYDTENDTNIFEITELFTAIQLYNLPILVIRLNFNITLLNIILKNINRFKKHIVLKQYNTKLHANIEDISIYKYIEHDMNHKECNKLFLKITSVKYNHLKLDIINNISILDLFDKWYYVDTPCSKKFKYPSPEFDILNAKPEIIKNLPYFIKYNNDDNFIIYSLDINTGIFTTEEFNNSNIISFINTLWKQKTLFNSIQNL